MNELSDIFDKIYPQYHPMVRQICLGYMKGDEEQANDLTQEVFINVWNALPNFQGKSSYKTWVYRITVNTSLNYLRKYKKTEHSSLDNLPSEEQNTDEPGNYSSLIAAIGQLQEIDRLIIMMVLDELEYDEIGEIMGISSVNLRVKIHRIKARLKKILENERV
ncbi:DNA-directed RNA polymerase sigma-70 factor [Marivirga lumbricoides]|uniref:DNA-directed RNA polymerase sigma-70 factor n=1 Tax=Marivirga lumbricoides TaxID=1046115 RepID=A0ABQ1M2Z7_9BACT|nr:DNA-directed RNA polymerase sigma-70 factor [Marivirga lumbricoides]